MDQRLSQVERDALYRAPLPRPEPYFVVLQLVHDTVNVGFKDSAGNLVSNEANMHHKYFCNVLKRILQEYMGDVTGVEHLDLIGNKVYEEFRWRAEFLGVELSYESSGIRPKVWRLCKQ